MEAAEHLKILVVDDDPFVRAMLGEILLSGGYGVETAESGEEALAKFADDADIGMVISDMNMPEMNGLEFVRTLRLRNTEVPVIILTVNNEIGLALDTIRSGANDYLLKDENIQDTILISVRKVMAIYQLEKDNLKLIRELARKNKALERLSFSDSLTGIPNRRYFDEGIKQEWGRAIREATPLSLIMADIDYFKRFNDTYGHPAGDRCLKQVAHALQGALKRFGDFVARYGGEEFAAVLPNTATDGAVSVAEAMCADVMRLNIPHAGSEISGCVTVSVGVSSHIPPRESDPSALIIRADQALYQAKQDGRNRVSVDGG